MKKKKRSLIIPCLIYRLQTMFSSALEKVILTQGNVVPTAQISSTFLFFSFFAAVLPLPGAMKHFSLFISKILCVCLVGFLQGGRVMISRSQWPTQGALNQRAGSGGFHPAKMSFISFRSVAFKVCCEQFDRYLFYSTACERGCTEFVVGIDRVGLNIVLNRTGH